MNPVHRAIFDYLRETSVDDTLLALTDQQLRYRMFYGQRGMRLTHFGLLVMQGLFRGYDVKMPADERLTPKHLIALDGHVKLPYFFNKEHIVVFDPEFGVRLRLAGGRLSTLMEIECGG